MKIEHGEIIQWSALESRSQHPAVRHCCDLYLLTIKGAQKNDGSKATTAEERDKARELAGVAYRLAMPIPVDLETTRACIACVAQGVALRVFTGSEATTLLYGCQISLSLNKEKPCPKPVGRPKKS